MNTDAQRTYEEKHSKTAWTEERLRDIFARYDRKYWQGRLPLYRLVIRAMPNTMGLCDWKRKVITIDVEQHKSDREVRSTLLHEMAHAAASIRRSRGHDLKFFAQLEKLLHRKAPIAIDTPEAGSVRIFANLVPSRFPLLKRKVDLTEARRVKEIERYAAEHNLPEEVITDDHILSEFGAAAAELTWKKAVIAVGLHNGMVDETGRPLSRWARRLLDTAKPIHARARRDYLQGMKLRRDSQAPSGVDVNSRPADRPSRVFIEPMILPDQEKRERNFNRQVGTKSFNLTQVSRPISPPQTGACQRRQQN